MKLKDLYTEVVKVKDRIATPHAETQSEAVRLQVEDGQNIINSIVGKMNQVYPPPNP